MADAAGGGTSSEDKGGRRRKSPSRLAAFMTWCFLLQLCGVLLFASGFLLSRPSFNNKSTCSESSDNQCATPSFQRVVVLVIDALRYDMAEKQEPPSTGSNELPPFHNRLPVIHRLLQDQPRSALLRKFVADAPTTTLQRLKGITTGGFPTFIDSTENTWGTAITEDNLIQQLHDRGSRIAFMGDDTWLDLFPTQFGRRHPFPSFDVYDLHTVDRGVLKHLYPTLGNTTDWEVLVGHFLGVDHCGHKHGPYHPAMASKLDEMNEMLERVTAMLSNDTLLVVLGDHGMTPEGEHGGETALEVDAALFLYGKGAWLQDGVATEGSVQQIDLVPTLSHLLGLPTPFGSMGQLMQEVLPAEPMEAAKAAQANARQVHAAIQAYTDRGEFLPKRTQQDLSAEFLRLEGVWGSLMAAATQDKGIARQLTTDYLAFVAAAQEACRSAWTEFDLGFIAAGIAVVLFATLKLVVASADVPQFSVLVAVVPAAIAGCCVLGLGMQSHHDRAASFALAAFAATSILANTVTSGLASTRAGIAAFGSVVRQDWFPCLAVVVTLLVPFSNSFVVNEDATSLFLFVSCFGCMVLEALRAVKPLALSLLFSAAAVFAAAKASSCVKTCREEQTPCVSSSLPTASGPLGLMILVAALWYWLSRNLNLSGGAMVLRLLVLTVVVVSLEWASELLDADEPVAVVGGKPRPGMWLLSPGMRLVWGRTVGALFVIMALLMFKSPLCVNVLRRHQARADLPTVAVQGGTTMYSAAFLLFVCCCAVPLCMLQDSDKAFSVFLVLVTLPWTLDVFAQRDIGRSEQKDTPGTGETLSKPAANSHFGGSVMCLYLLSNVLFFHTGHQPTFGSIRWKAGLVGQTEPSVVSPVLISLSAFGTHAILSLAVPLVAIWPLLKQSKTGVTGDWLMCIQDRGQWQRQTWQLLALWSSMFGLRCLASMVAATVLRRHLMVWKIFAPRMMFDVVAMAVVNVAVVFALAFLRRVDSRVHALFTSFKENKTA
eukprot:m.338012 g.338012  ORF g.338012 m.338012 type:complete len:997 (+) comp19809_c1_seq10:1096-4086(+)